MPLALFGQLDTVNIGSSANSGTGESLRAAFIKTNRHIKAYNAAYLYRLSLSGAHTVALTTTGNTALTLPTTGTLATTANLVSPAMTAPTVATTITPDASDGATLGTADVPWSDLFLAEGAVINFNASEITLTGNSSAGLLTIGGATFLDLASGILAGSTEIDDTELASLNGVTGSLNYSTENYGATGTGDIVLSTGPTLTTVNITDVIKLTPTASPPSGATEGMIYADTDHHLYYYNGTGWIQIDN